MDFKGKVAKFNGFDSRNSGTILPGARGCLGKSRLSVIFSVNKGCMGAGGKLGLITGYRLTGLPNSFLILAIVQAGILFIGRFCCFLSADRSANSVSLLRIPGMFPESFKISFISSK